MTSTATALPDTGSGLLARARSQRETGDRHPDTHLTVKPVIDLAYHVHVDAYEVPDRIKVRLALRDRTCVIPWCSPRPHRHPITRPTCRPTRPTTPPPLTPPHAGGAHRHARR